MTTICAVHADRPAVFACTQCGASGCTECQRNVADKEVCASCVSRIQQKVLGEMQSGVQPAPSPYPAPRLSNVTAAAPPVNLLSGAGAGIAVGILGAFIWDKIVIATHLQIGIVASLIGYAVGMAFVRVGKGHGTVPAVLSSVIALMAMLLGRVLLTKDMLAAEHIDNVNLTMIASHIFELLRPMDYVFIAIGVWGAWSTGIRGPQARF